MGGVSKRIAVLTVLGLVIVCILLLWSFLSATQVSIQSSVVERTPVVHNDLTAPHSVSSIPQSVQEGKTSARNAITSPQSLQRSETPASSPISPQSSPLVNPGCKAKTLHAYKAVYAGKYYKYPSLVHYAKLGSGTHQFNFREYTSVLSVYKFLKPEKIIFHTYTGFTGTYWDKIQELKDVVIEVKHVDPIHTIGGKHVVWIQHVADYVKLTSVYKYGGTALDFDVVIINGTRLKLEQSLSECVLAEETDFINGGFYSCIPNATFMAHWIESYHKDYKPHLWLHNISYRPLNLLTDKDRKECYNVHLDDTICLFPSWSVNKEWLQPGKVNWKTKTAAHYFVKDSIPNDGEGLLRQNFPLAELVQYVNNA